MNAKLPQVGELERLFKALKPQILDDYRAYEEAELPSMQVTVGWDNESGGWSWQTGDNSFTGGAYCYPHWAVVDLYRRSNSHELALEVREQLAELVAV